MNYFLTGKKGVGKSTLIDKVLAQQGFSYGGFRTLVCEDAKRGGRTCHMVSAFFEPALCEASSVPSDENAVFFCRDKSHLFPAFQAIYESIFASVEEHTHRLDLILMDELGPAEQKDEHFRRLVTQWLDADIPVFGVLQCCDADFITTIRMRRDVVLYEINEDNRDMLTGVIGEAVRKGVNAWNCR